jgi:two-component sensor histidine kinase
LALHELVTNAVKYGALSGLTGRVEVEWAMRCADQGRRLRFVWTERDGPIVQRPTRKGFGSRLIENGLARELDGAVQLEFRPTGVECIIDFPLGTNEGAP